MMVVNGTCERIKPTPIPYSYSFFIKCYSTIFIIIVTLVLVDSCGWWMVPITMIGAYAMLGLETIGNEIENPFGCDSNDLPITQISSKIRVSAHDLLGVELPAKKSTDKRSVQRGLLVGQNSSFNPLISSFVGSEIVFKKHTI